MALSGSLLPRVAAGEAGAVEECMDRYGNLVWSLARRFTRNTGEAEDAVQEIFIELWTKAATFDESKAAESTFVAMLARRRLIDRMRRAGRQPVIEDIEAAAEIAQPKTDADIEVKDDAARAAKLIESLKPEQQQIIRMAVYLGYTHRSIAEELNLPLGTVKTHLRRGLMKVRDAMRENR